MMHDLRILPFTSASPSATHSPALSDSPSSPVPHQRLTPALLQNGLDEPVSPARRTSHAQGCAAVVACFCARPALDRLSSAPRSRLRPCRVWTTHDRRCAGLHA